MKNGIQYGLCWEDADCLLDALQIRRGERCLSIASAGDNTLALLTADPSEVVAVDASRAQLACLALRIAAFRALEHAELLELIGSRPSDRRRQLYRRCRAQLDGWDREFWDARLGLVDHGIGRAGRLERYFALFRSTVLRVVHPAHRVAALLRGGTPEERAAFYEDQWNTARWRLVFRIFFSRTVMRLGRGRAQFRYVSGDVASTLLARIRRPLVELEPSANPYVRWILTGSYGAVLPMALRPEHFDTIRSRVGRVRLRHERLQDYLSDGDERFHRFNLSDVFEYLSQREYRELLRQIVAAAHPGGRLVYWNLFVPRTRPADLTRQLRTLTTRSAELHARDKAFFYSALVIEEVAS